MKLLSFSSSVDNYSNQLLVSIKRLDLIQTLNFLPFRTFRTLNKNKNGYISEYSALRSKFGDKRQKLSQSSGFISGICAVV